jgi:Icc-related predicted phosphoesterase
VFETDRAARRLLTNGELLVNQGLEFEGLKIWGSPALALPGPFGMISASDRRREYSRIPIDTDVLISHGPPWGLLDSATGESYHAGDPELLRAIRKLTLKLHVWGHIHAAHGVKITEKTAFVNAALLGEDGGIDREPIVLRIQRQ